MKDIRLILALLLVSLLSGCVLKPTEVVTQDTDYEITCRLPVRWEKRLDNWDEWLLPPEGQRFVWVYCRTQSLSTEPRLLRRKDFQMGYASAMAWVLLLIVAFFTALVFKSSSVWVFYESKEGE